MSSPTFTISAVHGNLNRGSKEDYQFSVTCSSSTANDMGLVKHISIQFPLYTVYDYTFTNTECVEHPSSTIEVEKCWIDTTTYTICVTPVIKSSTYLNSHSLII